MPTKQEKVIIYVRVSTEEQMAKGYSIDSQVDECKKKAYELGYTEDDILVISDGVSGGSIDRPGLSKLRDIVKTPDKPETIIMYDPDRFARKLTYQLIVTDEIIKQKISLEFIQFEWKNTAEGRMYYQLRGMFAEYEREKIRERTIRGRMTKIKRDKKLSYNPRLFGYRFDTEEDVLVVDPEQSEVVKLIFKLAALGNSGESIARMLAEDHVPAPRGDRWYGATVTRILNNESYLGTYWAYKVDYHQGFKRNRSKEEQFPIQIQPLVDRKTFDQAKKTLEKNRTHIGRPAVREYLLSGLGRCFCGKSVVTSVKSGNREYTYYSCVGKHRKSYDSAQGKPVRQCDSTYWNSSVVDQVIWKKVYDIIQNPEAFIGAYLKEKEESKEKEDETTLEYNIISKKYTKLKQKKDKLIDLYLSEGVDRETYDKKVLELEKSLSDIKKRKFEIEEEHVTNQINGEDMKGQLDVLKAYQEKLNELSFEQRKKIVNLLVGRVIFGENRRITIIFQLGDFNSGKSYDSEVHGRPS